jgi:hypothetical protein
MSRPASIWKRIFIAIAVCLVLTTVALAVLILMPSYEQGAELRSLLASASRVSVVEYGWSRADRVYADPLTKKDLSPGQIGKIAHAFSALGWLDAGKACDFEPHHKLICVMKDGVTHEVHLCFKCGDAAIDSGLPFDMSPWEAELEKSLNAAGIPVRLDAYRFEY